MIIKNGYIMNVRQKGGILMLYENLNQRKKELGLTTEQLSQLSGVPVGTINKILSGETRSPRYDTLRALDPAEASMIQLMTGQTVYGQKPAMRHIGICRMPSGKRPLRTLQSGRGNTR